MKTNHKHLHIKHRNMKQYLCWKIQVVLKHFQHRTKHTKIELRLRIKTSPFI